MKLKQRNLLLFSRGSAIASPVLMPHIFPFLCRSQKLLVFVLAGLSFQVVSALMPPKTANLTLLNQQIKYCTSEAVDNIVTLASFTYEVESSDSRGKNKDYKTGENQKYLAVNFDHVAPCLGFYLISK